MASRLLKTPDCDLPPDGRAAETAHLPLERQLLAMQIRAQRAELLAKILQDGPQPALEHRMADGEHTYKIDGVWTVLTANEVAGRGYKRSGEPLSPKALRHRASQAPGGAAKRKKVRLQHAQTKKASVEKLEMLARRERVVVADETRMAQYRAQRGETDRQMLQAAVQDSKTIPNAINRKEVKAATAALAKGEAALLAAVQKPGPLGHNLHNAIGVGIRGLKHATQDGRRAHTAEAKAKNPSKPSRREQYPQMLAVARRAERNAGNMQRRDAPPPPFSAPGQTGAPGFRYGRERQQGTMPCRDFLRKRCKYGASCRFEHGEVPAAMASAASAAGSRLVPPGVGLPPGIAPPTSAR
jgi:hypothetical protein